MPSKKEVYLMNWLHSIGIIILSALFVTGCSAQFTTANRSGTVNEDYIEEPLSERSKKYQSALEVSNQAIDSLISGQYDVIASSLVAEDQKSNLNSEVLESLHDQIVDVLGPIEKYKKMQWGFIPTEMEGSEVLVSIKIVEHQKGTLSYIFIFRDDGIYDKFIGFQVKEKKGVRVPNQLS